MQFVINGPDVPEELIQAQEEGRVVFFCGAGISYPAGLPLFKGLVQQIFDKTGMAMNQLEQGAFDRAQFDVTLDLLERRHQGGRPAVRNAMVQSLQPNLRRTMATTAHDALLRLARDKRGALRLVTTNFDRIFETVSKRLRHRHTVYSAPSLPIPKNSRWDGLVYLHGLQPVEADAHALNRLVVTSGDFGLAYLIERWASRFVTELFRNYVVCFVGYGINDPVLRYMMDALAADRMLGEATPQAYAFGSFENDNKRATEDEWRAKGVEPVLYEVLAGAHGSKDHSAMPRTLAAWAKTYQAGSLGKEAIVAEHASANPSESTAQDDFVGRMLWALAHPDGLPAKRFAEMTPCPPLSWLKALTDRRFCFSDLIRFGVSPNPVPDKKLRFSLLQRPSPYTHAPWMSLCWSDSQFHNLDQVMHQVSRWLLRHIGDPDLILWFIETGTVPHPSFKYGIETAIAAIEGFEAKSDMEAIKALIDRSPNSIPSRTLRALWRMYLAGRVKSAARFFDLHGWIERAKILGPTASVRVELRSLLEPQLEVRRSWRGESAQSLELDDERQRVRYALDWGPCLAAEHVQPYLSGKERDSALPDLLATFLPDLEQLLREAIELQIEIGDASATSDRSFWDLPSIEPHNQNRGFREWVVLIELLRDGWIRIHERDVARASHIARGWFSYGYATFRRLALFAASHSEAISVTDWITWLIDDNGLTLWSSETQREVLRLLALRGHSLDKRNQLRLENALTVKSARAALSDQIDQQRDLLIAEYAVWLRLAKLQSVGVVLGKGAAARLERIATKHPEWRLAENQSEEFSHWMSSSNEEDFDQLREIVPTPRKRREIVAWLMQAASPRGFLYEDTWRETCRSRFFHTALALWDLSRENVWPAERWKEALQAWSEPGLAVKAWRWVSPLIAAMPDQVFDVVARSVSYWIQSIGAAVDDNDAHFFKLCDRVLDGDYPQSLDTDEPLTRAINHPVGHVTQGLLNHWFNRNPSDGDRLPSYLKFRFSNLFDMSRPQNLHGRVILASRLITLFRIDQEWTVSFLVPSFNWDTNAHEARAAWKGFLWSPRLYMPLLLVMKPSVLQTASHFSELGKHSDQFAAFLTYLALGPIRPAEGFDTNELRLAITSLPPEGLHRVAATLAHAQEGAGERREEYWQTKILPFWKDIWPKDKNYASEAVSSHIANLIIATGGRFPEALHAIRDWLVPLERPHFALRKLGQSGLPTRFPAESLQLIDVLVKELKWDARDLEKCLDFIEAARPSLAQDPSFIRLRDISRALKG
ncbi:hypothetical protein FHT39_000054 [Mitsuaria sp. BK045]|uniref:anti-phage defense-associated sirtuin Dsr1 n=1 Tax=unclassified Roseateles TaxID=2626991 RepID=UPI00160C915F|nr:MULTISPECIES: anti-phage defense-associated sirtuin Dsr1 [unclassified Roseateles]MBB3291415.1 hypothetical protein [Mitsuaria sp. BK041]MBB3360632.1 hypothetical protein [Mitsuaria sp. BK045]